MFQENLKILLEADYGSWVLNRKQNSVHECIEFFFKVADFLE